MSKTAEVRQEVIESTAGLMMLASQACRDVREVDPDAALAVGLSIEPGNPNKPTVHVILAVGRELRFRDVTSGDTQGQLALSILHMIDQLHEIGEPAYAEPSCN